MLRSASLGDKLGDNMGPTHDDQPLSLSVGAHVSARSYPTPHTRVGS